MPKTPKSSTKRASSTTRRASGGTTKKRGTGGSTAKKRKRVALYVRVSTGEQTTANQLRELRQVARRSGWNIVKVYEDKAISGANGREKRPGLDKLLTDATARHFDLVAAWSVDRLGRSLQHLVALLGELHALKVDLYLHQQGLDTTTPSGRAMFGMLSVFADFEREMIRARVNAGIARARAAGKHLGRPPLSPAITKKVLALRHKGRSLRAIAEKVGVSIGSIHRIVSRSRS